MSCSCGLGTLPRSSHRRRSSYAPLPHAMPMSVTGETNCSAANDRMQASSSLASESLLWEPAGTTLLSQWPAGAPPEAGPEDRRNQSWLASSGSLVAANNCASTADNCGMQLRRYAAQTGRSALAPLGIRRQFGTSPAIASSLTPGSFGSGVASASMTASTSIRGPDERLLAPLTVDDRHPRSRRQFGERAVGAANRGNTDEDCWPLLAVSLALCAVSVLLLAVGGLFLGVHLRQRARSAIPSSSVSASAAAAAAAAAEASDSATPALSPSTPPVVETLATTTRTLKDLQSEASFLDGTIGSRMQSLLDKSIRACDDFHGYSCGRLGDYLTNPVEADNLERQRRRPNDLLELAGLRLRSELAVAMETNSVPSGLKAAYQRCRQLPGPSDACLRALRWTAPEAVKSLTKARKLNVTALHMALSDLFAGVVTELRELISVSPALTAHTRHWMDSRLSGLYLYVDSVGNSGQVPALATADSLQFAISGFNSAADRAAGGSCRSGACRPSSPDWSFGSACVCLSNATSADVAVSLAALRPELYSPSLSPALAHSFMGARLAEAAFAAVGPAHRRRFYSTESEARASAAVGCLSRRLRLPPGGGRLARAVASLAGMRAALAGFLRHEGRQKHSMRQEDLVAFFVNWAQTQCSLVDPGTSATVINWAVVESSSMALSTFLQAFNCTAGDAMMPTVRDDQLCRFP